MSFESSNAGVMPTEEQAVILYNTACDALEGSSAVSIKEATEMLSASLHILSALQSSRHVKLSSNSCVLQSRAHILLGQLIEWNDHTAALEHYYLAVSSNPYNPEAYVQLGRCLWKLATSLEELRVVEDHLRTAARLCDKLKHPKELEGSEDPTLIESYNLLARFLCQSPDRQEEAKAFLAEMGYKYSLSTAITSSNKLQSSTRRVSPRIQNSSVCAYDDILSEDDLGYMQNIFSSTSAFWSEHGYDSPTSGFFSYQISLSNTFESVQSKFESTLHNIWKTAMQGMPILREAKYAEWWCHSRPHCNGHKLHFDFVNSSNNSPRFPIASTVTFVTAECGGPTLVTDQRISSRTKCGWLVQPKKNRLVCFDGSLLHCVLPGQGPSPSVDARRVTFMVAFWKEDPRAPQTPLPSDHVNGNKRQRRSQHSLQWPLLLAQPQRPTESAFNLLGKLNIDAVTIIDNVVESVESDKNSASSSKKKLIKGIDMLDENVFTYFEALNSGLILSEKGMCSLNCGGTCPMCRRLCKDGAPML